MLEPPEESRDDQADEEQPEQRVDATPRGGCHCKPRIAHEAEDANQHREHRHAPIQRQDLPNMASGTTRSNQSVIDIGDHSANSSACVGTSLYTIIYFVLQS